MDNIKWLETWYASMCNGDWEDYYGIKINTIDNPGWYVEIDLSETKYNKKDSMLINIDNSENDWIFCKIENEKYIGVGDITKLSIIVQYFKKLVDGQANSD